MTSGIDEDRDLDRRLAGWMRNGPSAAPREVVDRALIETTTIVQLPKGGGSHAIRSIVIGTLLALIVLFLAVGLVVVLLR